MILGLVLCNDFTVGVASFKDANDMSFRHVICGVPQAFENDDTFLVYQNPTKVSTGFIGSFISPDPSVFYSRCVVG